MTTSIDYYRFLPEPHAILSLTPPETAALLKALNKNVLYTLGNIPTRPVSALRLLIEVLEPFLKTPELEKIFYGPPPFVTPQQTLYELYKELTLFNTLPATYDTTRGFFYTVENGVLNMLPDDCQTRLRVTLQNLLGIEFYLRDLADFWQSRHLHSDMTNEQYVARAFAARLQCEALLRLADGSLGLESVALITLLASPGHLSGCHLYQLSIRDEQYQAEVPLFGAFAITRKAASEVAGQNPCVLYVPGLELQAFHSPALLKAHVIAELGPGSLHRGLPCIDRNQLQRVETLVKQGLHDGHLSLSPVVFSQYFYADVMLSLVNMQRRNVRHAWAWAQPRSGKPAYWTNQIIETASDLRSVMTFETTVQKHAAPAIAAFEKTQPPKPAPAALPTAPKPINLKVYIHDDLKNSARLAIVRHAFFSWLETELEEVSGRKVSITFIQPDGTCALTGFNYKGDYVQVLAAWKERVVEHLNKTASSYSPLDLFLLLTRDNISETIGGMAHLYSSFAVAATTYHRAAAHEVGHMLGAVHEDGDNVFNGWWNETLMKDRDVFSFLRGNAYRFSDKNRNNIRTYLSQFD